MSARRSWLLRGGVSGRVAFAVLFVSLVMSSVLLSGGTQQSTQPISGQLDGAPPAPVVPAPDVEAFLGIATDQAAVVLPESTAPPVHPLWRDGELHAPLPVDPFERDAAVAQARADFVDDAASYGGVVHTTGGPSPSMVAPQTRSTHDVPQQQGVVELEMEERGMPTNRIPDMFGLTRSDLSSTPEQVPRLPLSEQDGGPAAPAAQAVIQQFDGIDYTNWEPPDPDLCVGPKHVMVVVNSSFAIFDKCGNSIYESTFGNFLGDTTNKLFDPKVVYDAWDGHWVMIVAAKETATQNSFVVMLVSDDNDPIGNWTWWYLDFTLDGSNATSWWADYPDVNVDPNGIFLTSNQFNWASPRNQFQYSKIRSLDKTQVYAFGSIGWYDFWNLTNTDATKAFTLRPARMWAWPSRMFYINSRSGGGSSLTLWEQTGTPLSPTLNGFDVPVNTYDNPPTCQQTDGTYTDTGDSRLLTAVYRNGTLWTTTSVRCNWGETVDRSCVQVYQINTSTRTKSYERSAPFGASGSYYCYPALDIDDVDRAIVVFARGGPTEFVGIRHVDVPIGGPFGGSALLKAGDSDYSGFSTTGVIDDPYRWGDYFGCSRDPWQFRTLWFVGQYADAGNWNTYVGASSFYGAGVLNVTPTTDFISTGLEGGPFSPTSRTYTLTNTGGAPLFWNLTGVNSWQTANTTSNMLSGGGTAYVALSINANANTLFPATWIDTYNFSNCYSGSSLQRNTRLTVGIDGRCNGSELSLGYDNAPTETASDDNQDRGVYVTAMKDFDICAVGVKMDLELPQVITARIYASSGSTRGALLASGILTATQTGEVVHYIPINYTLEECQEYDIAVEWGQMNTWHWWDERYIAEPYDVGGAIRVLDGESRGTASNYALPWFHIIGEAACPDVADLAPPGAGPPPNTSTNQNQERGIYVTAEQTISICSYGWEADLVPGETITARVYDATGTTRGALVAEGTMVVGVSGMRWHDIPLSAVLGEGVEYDIAIEFGATNSWRWWSDNTVGVPYWIDGIIRVRDAEFAGINNNSAIMHYRLGFAPEVAGAPFDLAKHADVYPPPNSTNQPGADYGAFVTALIDQEMYSIGWMADVPEGQPIGVQVYEATGVTRGALISEGYIVSSGPGMRWHDVPVAVSLEAGAEYDFSVDIPGVMNEWLWWWDSSGLPYDAYGVIRVRDGEASGAAGNGALLHIRMNACDAAATAVADDTGTRPPQFYLANPYPNPVSGISTIRFSLDEPATVNVTVYDVKGRRVATLADGEKMPAGSSTLSLNSREFASGIYFVKLSTPSASLTRKITVVR